MRPRTWAVAAATAVVIGGLVAASAASSAPGTFDGAPPAPLAFTFGSFLDGWDVQVHTRDMQNSPGSVGSFTAKHGADCSAPPATHATGSSIGGAVFQCANHVMTAISDDGYGAVYLTPPKMVDFASGGTVSFDLSTEKLSTRDWWDITVSPFLDSQALPLLSDLSQGVDLQEPNRNSIVITTDNGQGAPNLKVVRNGSVQSLGSSGQAASAGIAAGTNQAAARQPFRLTLSATHVRFERLASATGAAVVFVDQDIPALSWSQGVVNFGHHSYNPTKDGAGVPATWHWDNIAISPAVDFTIGAFTSRWTRGGTITSLAPAPAGSYLRFSAICRPQVNGVTASKMTDSGHPEHFSSYMVPVAAGASAWSINLIADDWYTPGFGCLAKDYSLFTPTGTASTSTPTATAAPPTVTRTVTPASTATSTPPATSTPLPTATPTQAPPTTTATVNSIAGSVLVQGRASSSGVAVQSSPGGRSALTAADGSFVISGLTAGQTYTITAGLGGYLSVTKGPFVLSSTTKNLPGTTLKAGDLDGDGIVSIIDVSLVAGRYGQLGGTPNADLNLSGAVDIADVSAVAGNYGQSGPTAW